MEAKERVRRRVDRISSTHVQGRFGTHSQTCVVRALLAMCMMHAPLEVSGMCTTCAACEVCGGGACSARACVWILLPVCTCVRYISPNEGDLRRQMGREHDGLWDGEG